MNSPAPSVAEPARSPAQLARGTEVQFVSRAMLLERFHAQAAAVANKFHAELVMVEGNGLSNSPSSPGTRTQTVMTQLMKQFVIVAVTALVVARVLATAVITVEKFLANSVLVRDE